MANTFTAPFVQTYRTGSAVVTTAVTGLGTDTVTGAVLIATAGVNGGVLTRLWAAPRATVTPASLLVFVMKADGFYRLKDSELMSAYTASTTTAIPETSFTNYSDNSPLRLEAGDKVYVASQVALAAGIVFSAEWGDL